MGSDSGRSNIDNITPASVVTVANPAAGADWTYTTTKAGLLVAALALFTTSAVVAARQPRFQITDGGGHSIWLGANSTTQPASSGYYYSLFGAANTLATDGVLDIGIPQGLVMGVGWTLRVSTAALDVADQWSAIALTFAG